MTNVLITGGAGFIGSHLADRLLDARRQRSRDRQLRDLAPRHAADTRQPARSSRTRSPTMRSSSACSRSSGPRSSSTLRLRTRIRRRGPRTAGRTRSAAPTSCAQHRPRASRASSTSRPRSATGCIRRSSPSRFRTRSTRGLELRDLEDRGRVVRPAQRARLDLVPPRQRLRAAQPQRAAADVLPAADARASRASSWTRAATSSSSTTWSTSR